MTKIKATKRSLIGSIMALVFCCSIFLGTTFAWFTSSATTNVNTIKAGKLKVGLVDADDTTKSLVGDTLNFKTYDNRQGDILWEPGCTYELQPFKVVNKGNLALKYKLIINGIDGDAELLEVLDFTVKVNGNLIDLDSYERTLNAGAISDEPVVISAHMKAEAGNKYQEKTLSGISIQVVATQAAVEYDSYSNQYDLIASSSSELATAIADVKDGGTIGISGNLTLPNDINSGVSGKAVTFVGDTNDATIDLGSIARTAANSKLTFVNLKLTKTNDNYKGFHHVAEETYINCTFEGTFWAYGDIANFVNCTFNQTDLNAYNIWTYGADESNFENCTFNSSGRSMLIYNEGGSADPSYINISKCTFKSNNSVDGKAAIEIDSTYNSYVVNIVDSTATGFSNGSVSGNSLWNHKLGSQATITVNGVIQ